MTSVRKRFSISCLFALICIDADLNPKDHFYKLDSDQLNTLKPVDRLSLTQISNQSSSNAIATSSNQFLKETETRPTLGPLKNAPPKGQLPSISYDHKKSTCNNAAIVPATSIQISSVPRGKHSLMRLHMLLIISKNSRS